MINRFLLSGVAIGAPIAAGPSTEQIPTWPDAPIQYRTSLDTGAPGPRWRVPLASVRALTRKIQRRRWLTERAPRESWRRWSRRVGIRRGGTERDL